MSSAVGWPEGSRIVLAPGNDAAQLEMNTVCSVGVVIYILIGYIGYQLHRAAWLRARERRVVMFVFWLCLVFGPFAVLRAIGPLQARLNHFAISFFGVLSCFRWIELACGTGPPGFDRSALHFVVYFASPAEVLFENGRFKKAPPGHLSKLILEVAAHMLLGIITCSLGKPTSFMPLLGLDHDTLAMPMIGGPRHLPALYLQATWVYCMLATNMCLQRIPLALFGVDSANVMRAPLWLSTSVRDFWGRRWNLLVHRLMKRTFFEPLAKGSAAMRSLGGLLAFLMSGLFHEYMWFFVNWPQGNGYVPGQPLLYFMLQFAICAVEARLAKTPLGAWAARLPRPVQVLYTISVALPLGGIFLRGIHSSMMVECANNDQVFEVVSTSEPAQVVSAWLSPDKALAAVATALILARHMYRSCSSASSRRKKKSFASIVELSPQDARLGA